MQHTRPQPPLTWFKIIFFLVLAVSLFHTPYAFAKQAGIVLLPTRIVLEKKDRFITVTVKNRGDATGAYRIELIDMLMPETGAIRELTANEKDPFSAKPYLRISPRQMVLKPDESQNVRILVRMPRELADGEYRSHLKVRLIDDNVDGDKEKNAQDNVAIAIKPRFSLIIPVILHHGETHYTSTIEKASLRFEKKKPVLDLTLTRNGNRSSMGDIHITYVRPDGKTMLLTNYAGIAIYRPTAKRNVSIPFDIPEGVSLKGGKLHITYVEQEKEGGNLIAETYLPL